METAERRWWRGWASDTGGTVVRGWTLLGAALGVLAVAALVSSRPPAPPELLVTDGDEIALVYVDGSQARTVDSGSRRHPAGSLPIRRVGVQPGSTADYLRAVYMYTDDACEAVGVALLSSFELTGQHSGLFSESNTLDWGLGYCATDPVWSPDGGAVAWVEREPGDGGGAYLLHARDMGPDVGVAGLSVRLSIDVSHLEDGRAPVRDLRATDWVWTSQRDTAAGVVHLSAVHEDGLVQAATLPVVRGADGSVSLPGPVQPVAPSGGTRPLLRVADHGERRTREVLYSLVQWPGGDVGLQRSGHEDASLRLPGDVLDAPQVQGGGVWLAGRGGTVAFGHGGDAWVVRWDGDGWGELGSRLPDVAHAVVLDLPAPGDPDTQRRRRFPTLPTTPHQPTSAEAPPGGRQPLSGDFAFVATDGEALTVHGPRGQTVLAEGRAGRAIVDFAVHPDSTAEDLTVVWRDGTGCLASLWFVVARGDRIERGSVPAECPGRPVFAPDGHHLAWIPVTGAERSSSPEQGFALETLAWSHGPHGEVATVPLRAGRADDGHDQRPYDLVSLDLVDWVWTDGADTPSTGLLHMMGARSPRPSADDGPAIREWSGTAEELERGDGDPFEIGLEERGAGSSPWRAQASYATPIERQDDGALVLPRGYTAEEGDGVIRRSSHGSDTAGGPDYLLRQPTASASPRDLVLARQAGDARLGSAELALTLDLDQGSSPHDYLWMTAHGDDVLLGDGVHQAWRLHWVDGRWGFARRLDGLVRYAVPLPRR